MEIPNYDQVLSKESMFKQVNGCEYMPNNTFKMLIAGPSGSGKTNQLLYIMAKPLICFDKLYLYARNLEQEKYKALERIMAQISGKVGYELLECSNDEILPVKELDSVSQKVVIFDDYMWNDNQKELINYFAQARHKNCSVIYLSQSFYGCPKMIRMNCYHFCVYEFLSFREKGLISKELGVNKEQYGSAIKKPFRFLYVDKPLKKVKWNYYGSL